MNWWWNHPRFLKWNGQLVRYIWSIDFLSVEPTTSGGQLTSQVKTTTSLVERQITSWVEAGELFVQVLRHLLKHHLSVDEISVIWTCRARRRSSRTQEMPRPSWGEHFVQRCKTSTHDYHAYLQSKHIFTPEWIIEQDWSKSTFFKGKERLADWTWRAETPAPPLLPSSSWVMPLCSK